MDSHFSNLFPHPLNLKCTPATSALSFLIKIGPLSLIHEKSVGIDQISAKFLHFLNALSKFEGSAITTTFSNLDNFSAKITISFS